MAKGRMVTTGQQKEYTKKKKEHELTEDEEYEEELGFLRESIRDDTRLNNREREVLLKYTQTGDVMSRLAVRAKIDIETIRTWSKGKSVFAEHFKAIKGVHLAFVESGLWDALKRREPWATKSYLSTHSEDHAPQKAKSPSGFDDHIEQVERGPGKGGGNSKD